MSVDIEINSCYPSNDVLTDLKNKKAYIGISIFHDFHTSPMVENQINWMEEKFTNYKILIGDYLYRHNRKILSNLNKSDYLKKCLTKGIEVSDNYLKYCKNEKAIIFWKEILYSREFTNEYELLKNDFENNLSFTESIIISCERFLEKRTGIKLNNPKYKKLLDSCIEYVLEELAVMSVMILKGYTIQIYFGTNLNILKEISKGLILSSSSLSKGVYIDLKIKKR